jgi:queuine tRNA-ribosyltransferase
MVQACTFKVLRTAGQAPTQDGARRGVLQLRRGTVLKEVQTPVFMPVGTLACIKGLDAQDVQALGARIMLSNAYHLMLRPGHAVVQEMGGLHAFMNYGGAVLTDSGGFQVYSLAGSRKITDAGVVFRSHLDGSRVDLTPEHLMAVQEALGPDIAMVLDECPPAQAPRSVVIEAMRRTTLWATRCMSARTRADRALFGIVQGALHTDLRQLHAQQLGRMPFDGFAIGGVSVGESSADIARIVAFTARLLPADRPRYLMGVGTPQDLVRGVAAGVDMFDCVMPTRNARNGQLFTSAGKLVIKNTAWRRSSLPIDPLCDCHTCRYYSRAYLRHLFVAKELTFYRLASLHNIAFYLRLMQRIRDDLDSGSFDPTDLLAQLETRIV